MNLFVCLPEGPFSNKVKVKKFANLSLLVFSIFGTMMRRSIAATISMCFTLLTCQGCLSHSDFAVISSKSLRLSQVKISSENKKGETQGRHCHFAVLFFTFGEPTNLEKALDEALLAKRAEILLNAEVSWQFVWIPFIYTQECWKVEGTAYDISK